MLNYVQDQSEHLMTLQKAFPREYPKYISYQWWKRIPTATIRKVQHANGTKIAYQDMNATMNPNHANVNTLPYTLIGLSAGIERAFWLTGFKSGAFHKSLTSSIFASDKKSFRRRRLLDKASRMCQRTKWSWDRSFGNTLAVLTGCKPSSLILLILSNLASDSSSLYRRNTRMMMTRKNRCRGVNSVGNS